MVLKAALASISSKLGITLRMVLFIQDMVGYSAGCAASVAATIVPGDVQTGLQELVIPRGPEIAHLFIDWDDYFPR
jgi:hypothetical protein